MNNPKINFNKNNIEFILNDNNYMLNKNHLLSILNNILSINHVPKYIKLRNYLLLFESNIDMFKFIIPKLGFLPYNANASDILSLFNNFNFRIIAGFAEQLKRVIPLEMKFEHRTDMIILFNSCDYELEENLRGTFNAPVYHADFFNEKQRFFKCNKYNYHLIENCEFQKYDNNLYTIDNKKYFVFADKDCECNHKNSILGRICYSKDAFLKFNKKDNNIFYYPDQFFLEKLEMSDKHIISIDLHIKNNKIIINILSYFKTEPVILNIKKCIYDFIKENQLIDYEIEINIKRFDKD